MTDPGAFDREDLESNREALLAHQSTLLRRLLSEVLRHNRFYQRKLGSLGLDAESFQLEDLTRLPFTEKRELVADQEVEPPFGTNLTYPLAAYARSHQTSGTKGQPLLWLDTPESWAALIDGWKRVYRAAGLTPDDRVFVAFSFGPFIGFWGAFEAAQRMQALTLTGGGLGTSERLDQLLKHEATILVSTPTYALRLAEVAAERGIDIASSEVTKTIHAGEPGASIPEIRSRLKRAWGAQCFDHAGATELGAWGYPGSHQRLFVYEPAFVAELVEPGGTKQLTPEPQGTLGELVLTSLLRIGSPLIRYRTGDLVELVPGDHSDPRWFLRGGVLARVDDMFVIRGVNVYPSAIERIVREFQEIQEFRGTVSSRRALAELTLEIEAPGDGAELVARLSKRLRQALALRIPISAVEPGSLPRFELKAHRFVFL